MKIINNLRGNHNREGERETERERERETNRGICPLKICSFVPFTLLVIVSRLTSCKMCQFGLMLIASPH